MTRLERLEGILSEKQYGEYVGGTLSFWYEPEGLVNMNVNGKGFLIPQGKGAEMQVDQTPEERYVVCKCYLKYKSPEHSLYSEAKAYVDGVDHGTKIT